MLPNRKVGAPRGMVMMGYGVLSELLKLPEGVYVQAIEYEAARDIFLIHVWGPGVPGMEGYVDTPEGAMSPVLYYTIYADEEENARKNPKRFAFWRRNSV